MTKWLSKNPIVAGGISILIWGIAVPVVKTVEDRIGLLAFMGFNYSVIAMIGAVIQFLRRGEPLFQADMFRDRKLYLRWLFFVLHEGLLAAGVYLVERVHLPFLILINYLWPTAIILCSTLLGTMKIRRRWAFIVGSFVVGLAMFSEVLGHGVKSDLFSRRQDLLAYMLVLIGAFSWGIYSALSRWAGGGSTTLPLFQGTLGLVLPISFLPGVATWSHLTLGSASLLVAYSSLLCVSYLTWEVGMAHGDVATLSFMADFIPWLSLLSTSWMLHVVIGLNTAKSAALLVAGAMLARYGILQKKPMATRHDELGF